ncbi:MAG: hypothetical protein ACI976_002567 [Aureispira sp.]|jgi:hypothetical protein
MTTTVKLFGLLILFTLGLISCDKDCDKARDTCKMDECSPCNDKKFEHRKGHVFDELGNKFTWDQFREDSRGKFLTNGNGHQMYCNSNANGSYYTNASGNNVYFKDLDWADKDEWSNKNVEKYILSPLVTEDECGYIVKGKIKYLVDGETAAIVDYGDGEIDAWAVKTIYFQKDGKCDKGGAKGKGNHGKKATKCCKFEQKCKKDIAVTRTSVNVDQRSTVGTLSH